MDDLTQEQDDTHSSNYRQVSIISRTLVGN